MIYLSCVDKLDTTLGVELDYVAKSFGVEAYAEPPSGMAVVLLQPQDGTYIQGETSLINFEHPADCVYLFGASNGHLSGVDYDYSVYIPHAKTWNLFAPGAAAIVLYDRYVKRGGFG